METPHYKTTHNEATIKKHYHKKQKLNLENVQRIKNNGKTILPSLRNIWGAYDKIQTFFVWALLLVVHT